MRFQVLLTNKAKSDLRLILGWIGERSLIGAETWYSRWEETLQSIRERADRYGLAPESDDHPELIRQAIFKTRHGRPYRALFIVHDRNVYILRVRGPNQDTLRRDEIGCLDD